MSISGISGANLSLIQQTVALPPAAQTGNGAAGNLAQTAAAQDASVRPGGQGHHHQGGAGASSGSSGINTLA